MLNAQLSHSVLKDANLVGADLSGTQLADAYVWNANLSGANLRGANLSNASLWDADLRGADLAATKLAGTSLARANLSGAKLTWNLEHGIDVGIFSADYRPTGLTQQQLEEAMGDETTELPDDLVRPSHWIQPQSEPNEGGTGDNSGSGSVRSTRSSSTSHPCCSATAYGFMNLSARNQSCSPAPRSLPQAS